MTESDYPRVGPDRIARPVMYQRWERLTMLHWRYEPAEVQALLPDGVEVDTFDGAAWVGLVPFFMRTRAPAIPYLPWLSNFPETNVRTYVRGPEGPAVWFCSLDVTRLPAVIAARAGYSLPYCWADMEVDGPLGGRIAYRGTRRWPAPRGASSTADISIGDTIGDDDWEPLDHWLTGRWALYSVSRRGKVRHAKVWHPPWDLHRATADDWDDDLIAAAGLRRPHEEPVVHYAPGVDVRIGLPRRSG